LSWVEMNLEVDSKDNMMHIWMSDLWFSVRRWSAVEKGWHQMQRRLNTDQATCWMLIWINKRIAYIFGSDQALGSVQKSGFESWLMFDWWNQSSWSQMHLALQRYTLSECSLVIKSLWCGGSCITAVTLNIDQRQCDEIRPTCWSGST